MDMAKAPGSRDASANAKRKKVVVTVERMNLKELETVIKVCAASTKR